jgi:hypothetical protein
MTMYSAMGRMGEEVTVVCFKEHLGFHVSNLH